MKTDRRHELQTNELANTLGHWTEAAKPYGRGILAGVIAVVVAIIAWGYVSAQNQRQQALGWNEFFGAMNVGDNQLLQDVAERYAGSPVGEWARLTLADADLMNGTNRLLTDRAPAREQLRDAEEKYRTLLLSSSDSTLKERATYGLARTLEANGELDKARDQYKAVVAGWPASPYLSVCEERIKALESQPTKQFYDWLAKYEPPKPLTGEPGTPGARPDFLKEPDAGTLQMPSSLGDSAPLPSLPSATGEAPAAETPATESPATEAASEAATPATEPEAPGAEPEPQGPQF